MLSVLWAVVVVGTLVLAAATTGRDAFDAGRNRVNEGSALWAASDCAERARLSIDSALADSAAIPDRVWRRLDAAVHADPLSVGANCDIRLEAAGTRLDINAASSDELTRLFQAIGRADAIALVDAILDWRDDDDDVHPNGAEAAWYASQRRRGPRNAPLANDAEIRRVRGFEDGIASQFLSVDPGMISIPNASAAVLHSLPGMTQEAADAIIAMRAQGQEVEDLLAFGSSLSSAARDSLLTNYQEISRHSVLTPDAWTLTATGRTGMPVSQAQVELRLVRTDRNTIIVRRRVRS